MHDPGKWDVVISGAGPAGAILAYHLARNHVKTLLIDKKPFPRSKTCGGGVTRRALDALPFFVDPVIEDPVKTVCIRVGLEPVFTRTLDKTIIGMVMRRRFDQYLVSQAIQEGAVFQDNTEFLGIGGKPGSLVIRTNRKKPCSTRIFVAADGVNSRGAKAMDFSIRNKQMLALEAEVCPVVAQNMEKFSHHAFFDFGVVKNGYGWIFPKKNHLSIGVLSTKKGVNLKKALYAYLQQKNLKHRFSILNLRAKTIPYSPSLHNQLSDERGLVIGDASGMTDPFTGEGIYHAVQQGNLASGIILKALDKGQDILRDYTGLFFREFRNEILYARIPAFFLYHFPGVTSFGLRHFANTAGDAHIDIMFGKKTYADLYQTPFRLFRLFSFHLK